MIAKLNELLVKFDALRDRLSERDKLKAEVDSLARQVEANRGRSASSKAVNSAGEKHFEVEAAFDARREEYTAKHSALLRELQQYNENRLDILSALLLDFFAAQRFFAYAYGRSLQGLHEQLREADESSGVPLPNPSWQMLMTYVTQTDDNQAAAAQSGEVRPSLIMKMATADGDGFERPRAFARPQQRSPPSQRTFTRPDAFASPDDVQFNPAVLHDPKNQPYLPLSVLHKVKKPSQVDASQLQPTSSAEPPAMRRGLPPPELKEPPPVTVTAPFPALHASVSKSSALEWQATSDAFGDGGPPRPPPPGPSAPRPQPHSSAGFDILSSPLPAGPSPPAPPPPPPQPAPPARQPGGPGSAPPSSCLEAASSPGEPRPSRRSRRRFWGLCVPGLPPSPSQCGVSPSSF